MPDIRRIDTADPLYPLACDLRERVLLRPIGLDMERFLADYAQAEATAEHFVAVTDSPGGTRVIATALLIPVPEGGKVSQVAVDPQRQGEGLGRAIMSHVEAHAFGQRAMRQLVCHAQVRAIGFYEKLGWAVTSEDFIEAGIVHRKMAIAAPPQPVAPPSIPAW